VFGIAVSVFEGREGRVRAEEEGVVSFRFELEVAQEVFNVEGVGGGGGGTEDRGRIGGVCARGGRVDPAEGFKVGFGLDVSSPKTNPNESASSAVRFDPELDASGPFPSTPNFLSALILIILFVTSTPAPTSSFSFRAGGAGV